MLGVGGCRTVDPRAGFESEIQRGIDFDHRIFYRRSQGAKTLAVFIDGDGSPWLDHGTRIAADPTPKHPLALDLAARTPGAVLYLARPCAFGTMHEASCQPEVWTSGRYSERVVLSMSTVLNRIVARDEFREVLLIGYSGGGALSVLMAPQVPATRAVLTVAANLDSEAWASWHRYLPLERSLNAALQPPLPQNIGEWHVVGAKDRNVPAEINGAYWARVAPSQVWTYSKADHACCWVALWPQIWQRLQMEISSTLTIATTQSPH
jgi:hypothetical protein